MTADAATVLAVARPCTLAMAGGVAARAAGTWTLAASAMTRPTTGNGARPLMNCPSQASGPSAGHSAPIDTLSIALTTSGSN